jgi:hypothetical protein
MSVSYIRMTHTMQMSVRTMAQNLPLDVPIDIRYVDVRVHNIKMKNFVAFICE